MRDLSTNTTTLVSQGAAGCQAEGCGNGAFDAGFAPDGLTPDGNEAFFVTKEQLSAADEDSSSDVYMRDLSTNTTTLVSVGAAECQAAGCGNGPDPATFNGVAANGSTAVFSSVESLAGADEDELLDVYARDVGGATTSLVSTPRPSGCPTAVDCSAVYAGVSATGSHVFFESSEQISGSDTDESKDIYDFSGGTATLASIGSGGTGNGGPNANYAGSTPNGEAVYFLTSESLDPTVDTDSQSDVYERSGGETTLVSQGAAGCQAAGCGNGPDPASFEWISPDGSSSAVLFSTAEPLSEEDEDTVQDVYERSGGETTLVSTGPESRNGPADASFAGASPDGSHLFFNTSEALLEEDQDTSSDIYERSGGETTLVSTGAVGGNGSFSSSLHGVSESGADAFFTTKERLAVDDDFLGEEDVYERSGGRNAARLGRQRPRAAARPAAADAAADRPGIARRIDRTAARRPDRSRRRRQDLHLSGMLRRRTGRDRQRRRARLARHRGLRRTRFDDQLLRDRGNRRLRLGLLERRRLHAASGGGGEGGGGEEGGSSPRPRPQKKAAARVAPERRLRRWRRRREWRLRRPTAVLRRRHPLRAAGNAYHLRAQLQDQEASCGLPLLRRDRPARDPLHLQARPPSLASLRIAGAAAQAAPRPARLQGEGGQRGRACGRTGTPRATSRWSWRPALQEARRALQAAPRRAPAGGPRGGDEAAAAQACRRGRRRRVHAGRAAGRLGDGHRSCSGGIGAMVVSAMREPAGREQARRRTSPARVGCWSG